jgi:hypothetical protein
MTKYTFFNGSKMAHRLRTSGHEQLFPFDHIEQQTVSGAMRKGGQWLLLPVSLLPFSRDISRLLIDYYSSRL